MNFIIRFTFFLKCKYIITFLQDRDKEFSLPLTEVSVEEILDAQRREHETKQEQEKLLAKALKERGLSYVPDLNHDDMF